MKVELEEQLYRIIVWGATQHQCASYNLGPLFHGVEAICKFLANILE